MIVEVEFTIFTLSLLGLIAGLATCGLPNGGINGVTLIRRIIILLRIIIFKHLKALFNLVLVGYLLLGGSCSLGLCLNLHSEFFSSTLSKPVLINCLGRRTTSLGVLIILAHLETYRRVLLFLLKLNIALFNHMLDSVVPVQRLLFIFKLLFRLVLKCNRILMFIEIVIEGLVPMIICPVNEIAINLLALCSIHHIRMLKSAFKISTSVKKDQVFLSVVESSLGRQSLILTVIARAAGAFNLAVRTIVQGRRQTYMRVIAESTVLASPPLLSPLPVLDHLIVVHLIEHHLAGVKELFIDGYMLLVLTFDAHLVVHSSLGVDGVPELLPVGVLLALPLLDQRALRDSREPPLVLGRDVSLRETQGVHVTLLVQVNKRTL
jgi:hypothetical protein